MEPENAPWLARGTRAGELRVMLLKLEVMVARDLNWNRALVQARVPSNKLLQLTPKLMVVGETKGSGTWATFGAT